MKDYTIFKSASDKDEFILSYRVETYEDGKYLVVILSSGMEKRYRYSEDIELYILDKMKNQLLHYKPAIEKFEKNKDLDNSLARCFGSFAVSGIACLLINGIPAKITGSILALMGSIGFTLGTYNKKCRSVALEDFKKNMLFINNEEYINNAIEDNKEILEFNDIKKYSTVLNNHELGLNLNSINQMSTFELKELLSFIEFSKKQGNKKLIKK